MFTKKNNVLTFNSNSKFKPFIFYKNYFLNHSNLLKENRNKIGIYRWIDIIDNQSYIGRFINFTRRFQEYYNINFLINQILKGNSL